MDEKAANAGDRMKHALLLETLYRTEGWPRVVYAETHGGAGIYRLDGQAVRPFIQGLRQAVLHRKDLVFKSQAAGSAYGAFLSEWWADPSKRELYPGSICIAATYLRSVRPQNQLQLRVTENAPETHRRLCEAVAGRGCEPVRESFYEKRDWLTEEDNLVLLIDPFGCHPDMGDDRVRRARVDAGQMDTGILRELLRACDRHERAVIQFWTTTAQQLRTSLAPIRQCLQAWADEAPERRNWRHYHDGKNHRSFLVGVGEGTAIVRDLPDDKAWRRSWLSGTIYEVAT